MTNAKLYVQSGSSENPHWILAQEISTEDIYTQGDKSVKWIIHEDLKLCVGHHLGGKGGHSLYPSYFEGQDWVNLKLKPGEEKTLAFNNRSYKVSHDAAENLIVRPRRAKIRK